MLHWAQCLVILATMCPLWAHSLEQYFRGLLGRAPWNSSIGLEQITQTVMVRRTIWPLWAHSLEQYFRGTLGRPRNSSIILPQIGQEITGQRITKTGFGR